MALFNNNNTNKIALRIGHDGPFFEVELPTGELLRLNDAEEFDTLCEAVGFTRDDQLELDHWVASLPERQKLGAVWYRCPGDVRTVGLVACSKSKLNRRARAEELYTGDLFKKSSEYVRKHCDSWAILSAKYGAISPDREVDPYDLTLSGKCRAGREGWADRVNAQLYDMFGEDTFFVVLCGELYRAPFETRNNRGLLFAVPMRGLGLGQQKAWLLDDKNALDSLGIVPSRRAGEFRVRAISREELSNEYGGELFRSPEHAAAACAWDYLTGNGEFANSAEFPIDLSDAGLAAVLLDGLDFAGEDPTRAEWIAYALHHCGDEIRERHALMTWAEECRVSVDNGATLSGVGDLSDEALERSWEALVLAMDDETRERVHAELAPCTDREFLSRYLDIATSDLVIG